MEGLGTGLSALAFWSFVAVAVVAGVWGNIRKREIYHETLRQIMDSSKQVDQELMHQLLTEGGEESTRLVRHLKIYGLVTLFTAPGIALLGWFISLLAVQALFPLIGVAALMVCAGVGLLVAAKVVSNDTMEDGDATSRRFKA